MRLESLRSYVYISDIILILYSRIIANTIKIAVKESARYL